MSVCCLATFLYLTVIPFKKCLAPHVTLFILQANIYIAVDLCFTLLLEHLHLK